jgi:hypothetical protein
MKNQKKTIPKKQNYIWHPVVTMAQPPSPFTFSITLATAADVPRIGEVSTRAFDADRNS